MSTRAEPMPCRAAFDAPAALLRVALLCVLQFGGTAQALSPARSVAGEVAVSSDVIDRGLRVGPNGAVLQVAASLTDASGWSLGLGASSHIRTGRVVHTVVRASLYETLSNDWQAQAGLMYYAYPDYPLLRPFDRAEAGFGWTYRDVLSVGVTAIYLLGVDRRRLRWAVDLGLQWPLGEHLSVAAGVGQTDFAPGELSRYSYGNFGLVWRADRWRWELSRQAIDRRAGQAAVIGPPPRWSATISRSF